MPHVADFLDWPITVFSEKYGEIRRNSEIQLVWIIERILFKKVRRNSKSLTYTEKLQKTLTVFYKSR